MLLFLKFLTYKLNTEWPFLSQLTDTEIKGDRSFLDWITQMKRLLGLLSIQKYSWSEQKQKV